MTLQERIDNFRDKSDGDMICIGYGDENTFLSVRYNIHIRHIFMEDHDGEYDNLYQGSNIEELYYLTRKYVEETLKLVIKPTYDELLAENIRLKAWVSSVKAF